MIPGECTSSFAILLQQVRFSTNLNTISYTGISIDLGSLECKKSCAPEIRSVELSASQDVKSPVANGAQEKVSDVRSPVAQKSPEQTPIAPGTPVAHLNSLRSHEAGAVADSDILEPTTSLESIEKWPSSSEPLELDTSFLEVLNFSLKVCML